jgi:predicted nucleotidyltransferase
MNPPDELIGIKKDSEQFIPEDGDVVIYSIKKVFPLLLQCNPNVIEMLGLRDEDYLYLDDTGRQLLQNKEIFLSENAVNTFGNYAKSQLNRLMNRSGRATLSTGSNEVRSLQKSISHLKEKEGLTNIEAEEVDGKPVVYINERMNMDVFGRVSAELNNVHADYRKSVRNDKAIAHSKIAKHMMHLLRLYMMGVDILADHEIVTYRTAEHDLLMDVRNGKYLAEDGVTPTAEFEKILEEYHGRFNKAAAETTLPKEPDYEAANQLMMQLVRKRI